MTFFLWACQFTTDPYVKMFHINEYNLTKKKFILLTKFVKHNTVHTTGNRQLHVQEKRQEREMSYKGS